MKTIRGPCYRIRLVALWLAMVWVGQAVEGWTAPTITLERPAVNATLQDPVSFHIKGETEDVRGAEIHPVFCERRAPASGRKPRHSAQ